MKLLIEKQHKELSGVYKITNIDNNKFYIGSTINFKSRFLHHKKLLEKSQHYND